MVEELDTTRENKPERDEKGRLLPGNTANPNGRPKGSLSITAKIKEELLKVPEGEQITFLDALIKRILKKAIIEEDTQMIRQIWNYVDGMPKQNVGFDLDDMVTSLKIEIIKTKQDGAENEVNNTAGEEPAGIPE